MISDCSVPDAIGAVLCKYSPGAATPQKQQWLREDLARLVSALHEQRPGALRRACSAGGAGARLGACGGALRVRTSEGLTA